MIWSSQIWNFGIDYNTGEYKFDLDDFVILMLLGAMYEERIWCVMK